MEFAARDGTRLAGTLTPGAAPAALILSGSGPLDRDSNMKGQALNVGNALAEVLATRGLASLRYDKRGVGESGGEYLMTGFEQETDDARAALGVLDSDRRVVIGHSVGARSRSGSPPSTSSPAWCSYAPRSRRAPRS